MIRFEDASFHYGGERGTGEGVDHITLNIADGECVVFCGRSGCGKTTLTRMINGLAPHFYEGEAEGNVYVGDLCVTTSPLSETSALVGNVFQNPKSQFFNVDTTGELAFGCENQAMSRNLIAERLEKTQSDLQLSALMNRNIFDLSGGEKQQIAFGSVYAAQPMVYVLDEPSSNLDRKAIQRLRKALMRVKEQGATIVVSEHRLYYLMDLVDRFIYLDNGRITAEFTPDELRAMSSEQLCELGLRCPDLGDVHRAAQDSARSTFQQESAPARLRKPSLEVLDLTCNRGGAQVLDIERLALPEHSVVALIGDNGCGKSTLSETLCGVIPSSGSVAFGGTYLTDKARHRTSFMVMQDVNRQLFGSSVLEEVMLNVPADERRAMEVLERLDLAECADRHPASLSGGQKQRVAIASALCAGKDILFYDEPTSGLDRGGMERFGALLRDMRQRVSTQVIVTHDPELVMQACTHVLRMENGRVVGFFPLDDEGERRVRYYFMSQADGSTSRKRERLSSIGKILSYAGKEKRRTIASAAVLAAGALCSVVPYLIAYWLVTQAISSTPPTLSSSAAAIAGILACLVLNAVLNVGGLQMSHRAAFKTLENLRCSLQEKLEAQPLGNVMEMGKGAAKKLFVDDIDSIELLLAHMVPEGIANLAVVAAVLLAITFVDWRLCLLTIAMVAFGAAATMQMQKTGADRMGSYFAATKRLNNTIIEYVNGMEVVRVFNRANEHMRKFEDSVHGYRDFALAWYKVCWPWMAVYGSIFFTCTLYTLPFGALLVLSGALSLQNYVLVLCLSFGIGPLLTHVMAYASAIPQVNYKIQSLEKSLDRLPLNVGERDFEGCSHDIAFTDVHFGYGNDEVLKGISFTAHEGAMTAIVGPSGSGKSTVAKLLAHFYDIESGHIALGGQDVRSMSLEALNSQVSYVSQELFLFNSTILENVRIGNPQASDQQVLAAAKLAQCDEFVRELPDGYQTMAGAAGGKLSGGQRQRIAFARAILKDAPVIVLDEATAFIDPENAEKMNAAVAQLVRDKTVLVIAHRLSSVVDADSIIVLDQGRIVDQGTHGELLGRCGLYRGLWSASEQVGAWTLNDADASAEAAKAESEVAPC